MFVADDHTSVVYSVCDVPQFHFSHMYTLALTHGHVLVGDDGRYPGGWKVTIPEVED